MMPKTERVILCPTGDDVCALRAMLRTAGASERIGPTGKPRPGQVEFSLNQDRVLVSVHMTSDKRRLAERALDVAEGGAQIRPDMLLVCFSPEAEPLERSFSFFQRDFEATRRDRASPLVERGPGTFVFTTKDKREVSVLAAPWSCQDKPGFADLSDEHNLERILIHGILKGLPVGDRASTWAEEATKRLRELRDTYGYKRALRIWNAALFPESASFVDSLLTNMPTKDACLAALLATPVKTGLLTLLGLDDLPIPS